MDFTLGSYGVRTTASSTAKLAAGLASIRDLFVPYFEAN